MNPTPTNDRIIKEITIQARAERVFEALTDPQQRIRWWGSEGKFRMTHMESDLRPGGAWSMRGLRVDGGPFTVRGEYRSIECPRLLEFTWLPDWQADATVTLVRFDLEERDGLTTVRLTHSGLATKQARESHRGWPQVMARLQSYLEIQTAKDAR
ncbi:MAG TPA: SRPBCC domain-containing protein [Blastocatellia bacterium]|nr:SRPBCC domain-containing protein [Blastocatellia bacterium]